MTTYTKPARRWAWAACVVGVAYALVSLSWALGSTWLLDTIGGDLESNARADSLVLETFVWTSVLLKLVAALLGLAATGTRRPRRWLVVLAWTAAGVLTSYGGLYTFVELLVQANILHARGADQHALLWHTYLWDPWFLVWGLLLTVALLQRRAQQIVAKKLQHSHA